MNSKVVFVGCSFTAGSGWVNGPPDENSKVKCKKSPHLWVNLCHQNLSLLKDLELVNNGNSGASNTEIFETAVRSISLTNNNIKVMFCQWTAAPRYNFNVGFELWDTSESLSGTHVRNHDINLNKGDCWTRSYVTDLLNRLHAMHHLHWEIVKIIDYSAILSKLASQMKFDIFFINGLCPWDKNYFTRLENVKPEEYTPFTKKEILNIETRDDSDIIRLYNLAHDQYRAAGGLDEDKWINLYDSFLKNQIDTNYDLEHPGKQSNFIFYSLIKQKIEDNGQKK